MAGCVLRFYYANDYTDGTHGTARQDIRLPSPSKDTSPLCIQSRCRLYACRDYTEDQAIKGCSAQRTRGILSSGLVRKKGTGVSLRYQTNPRFEHLAALGTFIRGTTSVRPKSILAALRRAGTLRLAALSGLFTGVLESQIDLLVVGDHLDERVLSVVARSLEAELGREIRYASFETADFRYRLGAYDRLLRDVFDYPHRLLIDKIGL